MKNKSLCSMSNFSARQEKVTRRLGGVCTLALLAISLTAQAQSVTTKSTAQGLTVDYEIALLRPTSDYATVTTPMICTAQGDTLRLDPITVRGLRNAQKLHRDYRLNKKGQPEPAYIAAAQMTNTQKGTITLPIAQYPWARQPLTLCTLTEREGCCCVETVDQTCSQPFRWENPFVPSIALVDDNTGRAGFLQKDNPVLEHISKYRPYDKTRILRKEKGMLYVHFPLDKTTLLREFRDNAPILDRIIDITRQIMADTTSSVEKFQIIGMASIEGRFQHNSDLGQGRAEALRDYVMQQLSLPESLFELNNGAEAWTEFLDQLHDAPEFEGKEQVLQIIDTEPNLDRRELLIKRLNGGRTYQYIRENILADQRNSGYIRIYWDYVPDKAARSINAASEMIQNKQYSEAIRVLRTVEKDPRAWNTLATALYLDGQQEEAIQWYRKAAAQGNQLAKDNLRGILGE